MNHHKLFGSLALVFALAVASGCSDDKSSKDDATETTVGSTGGISKADFLTQANALCATFDDELSTAMGAAVTEDDRVAVISDVLVPGLRRTLNDIEALGFPAGDEALMGDLIAQTNEQLDAVAADPAAALNSPVDPFAEINAQLVDYGLTVCGS